MATIERKPLPPLDSRTIPITEADRAEIMARANDVLDYYLNGPGSYFDAVPRKPVEFGDAESTVTDLQKFRDRVVASQQFTGDPGTIMQSVIDLINRTIDHVKQAAQDNEGRDRILRQLPDTNDRIELPRQKGNPVPDFFPEESWLVRPLTERPSEPDPATAVRILARRITSRPSASPFGPPVQPDSDDPDLFTPTSFGADGPRAIRNRRLGCPRREGRLGSSAASRCRIGLRRHRALVNGIAPGRRLMRAESG